MEGRGGGEDDAAAKGSDGRRRGSVTLTAGGVELGLRLVFKSLGICLPAVSLLYSGTAMAIAMGFNTIL